MVVRPESIEEWCFLVPHLFSDEGWQRVVKKPSSALLHCSAPWGGSLVKFVFYDLLVLDPPEDSADVFIRPETRAWTWSRGVEAGIEGEGRELQALIAPGDCCERYWAEFKWSRLCDALLGMLQLPQATDSLRFAPKALPVETRERLRRNFPEMGDCSLLWGDEDQLYDCVVLCRRQESGHYLLQHISWTVRVRLPCWALPPLRLTLDVFRASANWYLNRPQILTERQRDKTLYLVLTLTSFNWKWPLIPAHDPGRKGVIRIDAGRDMGLATCTSPWWWASATSSISQTTSGCS